MSYKKVTELRKSGKLEEALELATRDFETIRSTWSASALFWVLYDMSKAENSDLPDIVARMEPLISLMDSPDIAQKCLTRLKQQADKDYQDAWNIYNRLKEINANDTAELKGLSDNYWHLDIQRPSLVHSLILRKIIQFSSDIPNDIIYSFFNHSQALSFRDEDWETDDYEKIKPLAVKAISLCAKLSRKTGKEPVENLTVLARQAAERFKNDVFLKRDLATTLSAKGEKQEAIEIYRSILKSKSDAYLWDELAHLTNNTDLRRAALCKALLTLDKPEFTLMIHLRLAFVLAQQKDFPHALHELSIYRQTCEQNGWKIKPEYNTVSVMISENTEPEKTGIPFYNKFIPAADEFVYGDIPATSMYAYREIELERDGRKTKFVILAGAEGLQVKVPFKKLMKLNKEYMHKCYDARLEGKKVITLKVSQKAPEDIFGLQSAIVDNVNHHKKVYHIANKDGLSAVIPFTDKRNYSLGDIIEVVAIKSIRKDGRVFYNIILDKD